MALPHAAFEGKLHEMVGLHPCSIYTRRWQTCLHIREELSRVPADLGALRSTVFVTVKRRSALDWIPDYIEEIQSHLAPTNDEADRLLQQLGRDSDSPALSLLDVAIVSGDTPKAIILHSIGVPQRYEFQLDDFLDGFNRAAGSRTTRALDTVYQLHEQLFCRLCADEELLGRAIAGGQDSLSALLVLKGASEAAMKNVGHFLFRMWTPTGTWLEDCELAMRMDCLLQVVDLGIDVRSLVVDPCLAFYYACADFFFWRPNVEDFMVIDGFGSLLPEQPLYEEERPLKWRPGQTLLEMAIRCGQLDATRYLTNAHCEATGLTADDLTGPMFQETDGSTVNRSVGAAEAAQLAYHLCRHRYQIVIVQMTGWWTRSDGRVSVTLKRVVDDIAAFALAVPALSEIRQLPRRAGQLVATMQQVVKPGQPSENEVQSSVQVKECREEVGPEVIQEVMNESQETVAVISEDVAQATSHALWATGVAMRVARDVASLADPLSQLPGTSSHQAEMIYLGKLNRIPGQLLRELASGPALQPCRRALEAEGFPWKLSSGAFMFVSPCQHVDAMTALADEQLHPDNIIFAESVEYLIDEVLGQHGTWMKDRSAIGMDGIDPGNSSEVDTGCHAEAESQDRRRDAFLADYRSEWDPCSVVSRTFLCLAPVRSSLMVTASTTDASSGKNWNPESYPVCM